MQYVQVTYDTRMSIDPALKLILESVVYRIARLVKISIVFVVEHWTTNILPTNEATLPLPAVQAATTELLSTK